MKTDVPTPAALTVKPRAIKLRRSDCSSPGILRRRRGKGFSYVDSAGNPVRDPETLIRIRELAIPPAWQDVWICTDQRGHLQATGTDAAGRKQYLYHERWRQLRDRKKFREMVEFGQELPTLRRRAAAALEQETVSRERVLGGAVRLLDKGLFRIGSSTGGEDTGLGLASVRREHVSVRSDAVVFDFIGKAGVPHVLSIDDPASVALLRALMARRSGPPELLAYRDGRVWRSLPADDINAFIKDAVGPKFSAKSFRTWHATVIAAGGLAARVEERRTAASSKRAMRAVAVEVSEALGNTPTVARSAYIDPRVFDRYLSGWVIKPPRSSDGPLSEARHRELELAVLDLLAGDYDHPRVVRAA